jgi:hypothetical protein
VPTVIVAIPSEDDYVWKVSSDKVPHLTLLNLGDETDPGRLAEIASYLQHVANTSLKRFGLTVTHRGPLGPKPADVLFFERRGWEFDQLEDVRSFLRKNRVVDQAYNAAVQFPEWIPHLTLGFPESPAHPDARDWPGFSWVNFTKIALWDGDFTGPEFRLAESSDWGLSMSNAVDDFLEHFGVRGMKWGVRRAQSSKGGSTKVSTRKSAGTEEHQNTVAINQKARKGGGTKALSNKELADAISRMNLEQQYTRLSPQSPGSKAARFGGKFVADILIGVGKAQAVKLVGDQASKLVAAAMAAKKATK